MKKGMRKAAWAFLAIFGTASTLIVWAAILAFLPSNAHAAESEFRWQHYGADPFATTRAEAMARRERVFRESFGFSNACVAIAMKATSAPGEVGHLNKGDRRAVMVSRNFVAHQNTVVDFPPVRKGIEYAAITETWKFECDGQRQKIDLPEICQNFSLDFAVPIAPAPPQKQQEECVEDRYNTEEGEIVRFAVLGDKPLPPSSCWALKAAGDSEFRTPPVQCPDADCDFSDIVAVVGMTRQHSGGYVAHKGENIFRFPAIVARNGARYMEVFCKQYAGRQTMGVGIRWVHYLGDSPKRAIIYDSPDLIPGGLSQDYDLAWRWIQ